VFYRIGNGIGNREFCGDKIWPYYSCIRST
jgi:hypothetical protein